MMKRTGVTRIGPDEPNPLPQSQASMQQQPSVSNLHAMQQAPQSQILGATTMLSVSGSLGPVAGVGTVSSVGGVSTLGPMGPVFTRAPRAAAPVLNYIKPGTVQYTTKQQQPPQQVQMPPRHKPASVVGGPPPPPESPPPVFQLQRLKVDDALSYLDQVKYKFHTQPQVYNNFLDIMKDFKSKTIDTPGVITRVSSLFKGHPELIVGFNTFLPPGYKIEVQSNGQVSVSMPSPGALGGVLLGVAGAQPQLVQLLPAPQPVGNAIVHNLSVNAPPSNTLHHISQAHQQIEAQALQQQQAEDDTNADSAMVRRPPPTQPVEFNHAIEYVNKIKSRFSRQPDKYKAFLEILHDYQRGHRTLKPQLKQQMEQEVYSQVAKLFENQDDLLAEFGQFLPDAKAPRHYPRHPAHPSEASPERASPPRDPQPTPTLNSVTPPVVSGSVTAAQLPLKRSPTHLPNNTPIGLPPVKKARVGGGAGGAGGGAPPPAAVTRDVSLADAAKYATLHEYNFFDRVRKALKSPQVYDNFLRCLMLYTREVVSGSELCAAVAPFLRRAPELQRWLHTFVQPEGHKRENHRGHNDSSEPATNNGPSFERERLAPDSRSVKYEPIGHLAAQMRAERPTGDVAMDIDLSTCRRLGTSYCALPRVAADARKCSGRTPLCKEVLNDTWVSFPSWSEDSTFVTSRKTQYEEYIYRCEDERFELDVVIETNASTIRVLEGVQKKLSRMSHEDAAKHRLDDTLGGTSQTIHRRAVRTIYGDKAVDIIAGLKKNPAVAVPVVLRRLKAKEEEWREAQKGFNKQWRELNEKYYLKSLDHQGINFKQNDVKALRSKCMYNEIEAAHDAGRPLVVDYGLRGRQEATKIVGDACELLIHHLRRQAGIHKAEKRRMKTLLRRLVPSLLRQPPAPRSDSDTDPEDKDELCSGESGAEDRPQTDKTEAKHDKEPSSESDNGSDKSSKHNRNKENTPKNNNNSSCKDSKECKESTVPHRRTSTKLASSDDSVRSDNIKDEHPSDEDLSNTHNCSRFICSGSWYVFLRLHAVLCARLSGAAAAAAATAAPTHKPHPTHIPAHNNMPMCASSPSEYYPTLLELVKAVLDGNCEPSAYEDAVREMLGIKAYPLYTLDKVVSSAVRQLQHCVSEPRSLRCATLHARHGRDEGGGGGGGGGGAGGAAYRRRALHALRGQHAFHAAFTSTPAATSVHFTLLDNAERHAHHTNNKPVFLRRNLPRHTACPTNRATQNSIPAKVIRRKRTPIQQRTAHPAGTIFLRRRNKKPQSAQQAKVKRKNKWLAWLSEAVRT